MLVYIVAFVVGFYFFMKWRNRQPGDFELLSKYFPDKNWLNEDIADRDQSVRPFKIQISEQKIDDLNKRLDLWRFPVPSISSANFRYGIRDDYMKNFVKYWRNEYSWKKQEEMINSFDHFKTNLEGLDVHFVHVEAKNLAKGVQPKILLLLHGWPGSFVEYLEAIDMLTDPKKHGGNETDAFTVICPSIPGFGFSDAPQKEGFNIYECARVFHKLMLCLEYKKYYVAGGDWGSLICTSMSAMYPSYIKACYTTLALVTPSGFSLAKTIFGSYVPGIFFSPIERKALYPLKKMFGNYIEESGYFHLQGTKPDTIGFALSDSPVGMSAYIIEKLLAWTSANSREFDDGLLNKHWTYDKLLNNVMIYWLSGNITSSMRFYKENFQGALSLEMQRIKVRVPSGHGWFPEEYIPSCKMWIQQKFQNLIHFTCMSNAGHFSSYQQPGPFADDLKLFLQKVDELEREQAASEMAEANAIQLSHLDGVGK